jgi:hypothetical protein
MFPSPQPFQLFRNPLLHPRRFVFVNAGTQDLVTIDIHMEPRIFADDFVMILAEQSPAGYCPQIKFRIVSFKLIGHRFHFTKLMAQVSTDDANRNIMAV